MRASSYTYSGNTYIELTNTEDNHNKFYKMEKNKGLSGTFTITYGAIGTRGVEKTYPLQKWHDILDSKLNKGYVVVKTDEDNKSRLSEDIRVKMEKLSNLSKIYKLKNKSHHLEFNEIEIISNKILTKQIATKEQLDRITDIYVILTDTYGYKINL